jgi:TatD DNase family protein
VQFVDSHAHLTDEAFADDLDAVIGRAQEAGIARILTLGTDVKSSRAAIVLAERYEMVYAAVGIHPEGVRGARLDDLEILRELASHPKVVAIGEIGLDFYWDKASADSQQVFFERQLEAAAELNLPVSIHDRAAHHEIIATLRKFSLDLGLRGVLHAFSGDEAMAREAIDLGFLISFAGPITFLNAHQAPDLVPRLPLEKILIETDSPYLSPHPLRGRRNEPANVTRVAMRIAELSASSVQSEDPDPKTPPETPSRDPPGPGGRDLGGRTWGALTGQVAAQTARNARALFGF